MFSHKAVLRNVTQTTSTTTKTAAAFVQQPPNKFAAGEPLKPAVKTYIARISYESSDSHRENSLKDSTKDCRSEKGHLVANAMESTRSSQLLEDFAKKKQERDQEIMEIQEMLNKIKSPQKSRDVSAQNSPGKAQDIKPAEENEKQAVEVSQNQEEEKVASFRRSRTELQLNAKTANTEETRSMRVARKDTARSSVGVASSKPRSKSSQLPLSAKETQAGKKISYNPEEARRYMEMQKKQRKVGLSNDPAVKSKIEKEEIKKRLEELKKNTRKLVSKNIQKKEKIMSQNVPKKQVENKVLAKPVIQQEIAATTTTKATKDLENELKGLKLRDNSPAQNSKSERSKKETKLRETSHRSSQSSLRKWNYLSEFSSTKKESDNFVDMKLLQILKVELKFVKFLLIYLLNNSFSFDRNIIL